MFIGRIVSVWSKTTLIMVWVGKGVNRPACKTGTTFFYVLGLALSVPIDIIPNQMKQNCKVSIFFSKFDPSPFM